jgi:hypothetical protein
MPTMTKFGKYFTIFGRWEKPKKIAFIFLSGWPKKRKQSAFFCCLPVTMKGYWILGRPLVWGTQTL